MNVNVSYFESIFWTSWLLPQRNVYENSKSRALTMPALYAFLTYLLYVNVENFLNSSQNVYI